MIPKPTPRLKEHKPLKSRPHSLPPTLRFQVMERDESTCRWCHVPGGRLDVHHILPRSRGGRDVLANLAALHRACHRAVHEHPTAAKRAGLTA